MIQRTYLILFGFSIILTMTLWLAGSYRNAPEIAVYAMFYGIILPTIWALLTYGKELLCRTFGAKAIEGIRICPVNIFSANLWNTVATTLLSWSLALTTVLALAFLAGIEIQVSTMQIAKELSLLGIIFIIVIQIPVGTMEEGVFRQAIPEFLSLLGGHPLFYAFLSSILFGLMHLWAYANIFLTISASAVGIVNSLIYYGFIRIGRGNITGISLGHTMYNVTVSIMPASTIVSLVTPLAILIILTIIIMYRSGVGPWIERGY